jgi:2-keto-4-pentenoate hydratase
MTDHQLQAASDMLWDHWQRGRRMAALPEAIRPLTRKAGYAIQARLEGRTAFPIFGWKIAATSRAGQKHIGVDGPLAGRLLRERARESGDEVPFGANHMRVAEAEFAFRMALDLPPRATPYLMEEVLAAVDTFHPAIEVPDSRYDDFAQVGAPQLIADNACAHYFVIGPAARADWRTLDLSQHAVGGRVHGKLHHDGIGANVLGDPCQALTWLANELSQLNQTLRASQVVITGTCLVPLPIEPGDHVAMDFGILGTVEARL